MKHNVFSLNSSNDIKYKGPLSYMSLRLVAWIGIFFLQLGNILEIIKTISNAQIEASSTSFILVTIFQLIGRIALPCFIISTYTVILQRKSNQKKFIFIYGLASLGIIALYYLIVYRYVMGLFTNTINISTNEARVMISSLLKKMPCFNVFIDLFICVLIMFFANYEPKKFFQGKKIIWFRLLIVFPFLYEIIFIVIKLLCQVELMSMPLALYPFLPTKSFLMLMVFVCMVIFLKHKKKIYLKKGNSEENYEDFLKSNKNSFQFSFFMSTCFFIAGLIAIIIIVILYNFVSLNYVVLSVLENFGISDVIAGMFIIPIILLYSYTKKPKLKKGGIIIPAVFLALILLLYLEAGFQIIKMIG